MKFFWMAGLLAISSALILAMTDAKKPATQASEAVQEKLSLHDSRTSPTDLLLSGDVPGTSDYAGHYVAYSELLKLPQVTFTVTDDSNFPGKAEIKGVYLDELLRIFGIPNANTLIGAYSDDGYEGHYPVEYRAAHHPILVLQVNGKKLQLAKRSSSDGIYGPYLVSHPSFTPRYIILAHSEEAQIPNGVLELRFVKQDEAFGVIQPRGNYGADSPQMQGYNIAQQNCFRCHNAGAYGGSKAGISWSVLGKMATTKPDYFKAYIKDPEGESAYAEMPGFPEYDDATLTAITAYFQAIPANIGQK
jgi:mono/diheme cytochrome c family protein